MVPWESGSPEMAELVRLGAASEGQYEDQELLDVAARLPQHHRQLFDKLMHFMREIDFKAAEMSSKGLATCIAPDWFGASVHTRLNEPEGAGTPRLPSRLLI